MSTNLYQIESQSKYMMVITRINNIEDATDDFVTEEELDELLGEEGHVNIYGATRRKSAIIAALTELRNKIVADGKRTILIKDDDLMEMFKETGDSVSEYVDGLRRVGNRLFLHEANKPKAKKSHVTTLAYRVAQTVNKGNKFELEIKYASQDVAAVVLLCKKLVSWDDIDFGTIDAELVGFMKEIWDNPTMFDKVESPT